MRSEATTLPWGCVFIEEAEKVVALGEGAEGFSDFRELTGSARQANEGKAQSVQTKENPGEGRRCLCFDRDGAEQHRAKVQRDRRSCADLRA